MQTNVSSNRADIGTALFQLRVRSDSSAVGISAHHSVLAQGIDEGIQVGLGGLARHVVFFENLVDDFADGPAAVDRLPDAAAQFVENADARQDGRTMVALPCRYDTPRPRICPV